MGYQHIPKMIGTKKTTLQTTPSLFLVLINMKEKHIPSWVSYWERLSQLFRSQRIHGWPTFLCVRRTRYITIREDTGMETWLRFTSWWFQPISKIWSSNWIISPTFGMKTTKMKPTIQFIIDKSPETMRYPVKNCDQIIGVQGNAVQNYISPTPRFWTIVILVEPQGV